MEILFVFHTNYVTESFIVIPEKNSKTLTGLIFQLEELLFPLLPNDLTLK